MLAKSASSLPSRALQILLPMRSFCAGSMPYSLGITASARTLAVCTSTELKCQFVIWVCDFQPPLSLLILPELLLPIVWSKAKGDTQLHAFKR